MRRSEPVGACEFTSDVQLEFTDVALSSYASLELFGRYLRTEFNAVVRRACAGCRWGDLAAVAMMGVVLALMIARSTCDPAAARAVRFAWRGPLSARMCCGVARRARPGTPSRCRSVLAGSAAVPPRSRRGELRQQFSCACAFGLDRFFEAPGAQSPSLAGFRIVCVRRPSRRIEIEEEPSSSSCPAFDAHDACQAVADRRGYDAACCT